MSKISFAVLGYVVSSSLLHANCVNMAPNKFAQAKGKSASKLNPTASNTMKNIDYLALGYNIYKANPFGHGSDSGFASNDLFYFTYSLQRSTEDLRYAIPDNVDLKLQ